MSEFAREEAHSGSSLRERATTRASRAPVREPVAARLPDAAARSRAATRSPQPRHRQPAGLPAGGATARGDRDGGDDQLWGEILGGLAGGGVGAAIGGLVGGGVGALIGGVIGAVAGGIIGHLAGGGAKTVTINVTRLAGVTDTIGVDVARANAIYRQASLHVATGRTEVLSTTESNAVLGADGALASFSGNTLTTEEQALVAHNRTPGRITAYYVPRFTDPGLRGEAIRPSRFAVPDPSVVVGISTRVLDTLAHELGHVLTNDGSHSSDASNLMARGAIRNFTDTLTSAQISAIQSSPYAR